MSLMAAIHEASVATAVPRHDEALLEDAEREMTAREQMLVEREDRLRESTHRVLEELGSLRGEIAPSPGPEQAEPGADVTTRLNMLARTAVDIGPRATRLRAQMRRARRAALTARERCTESLEGVLEDATLAVGELMAELSAARASLQRRTVQAAPPPPAPVPPPIPVHRSAPIPLPSSSDPIEPPPKKAAPAAPPVQHDERRSSPRVPVRAAVTLGSDDNFYTGFSTDLSDGGIFVATIDLLPSGTLVDLCIDLPNGEMVEARGRVRWLREFSDMRPMMSAGMGIQFVDLDDEQAGKIHYVIEERETLFYVD